MNRRYVAERGSGSSGTAYNLRDWEVIDTGRTAGHRVICRAGGGDARMIAAALNEARAAGAEPLSAAAE